MVQVLGLLFRLLGNKTLSLRIQLVTQFFKLLSQMIFVKCTALLFALLGCISLSRGEIGVEKAVASAGAAIIIEATGVDLQMVLSLLKTETTSHTTELGKNSHRYYKIVKNKSFENRMVVKEEVVEKKLQQLFLKMAINKKDQAMLQSVYPLSHANFTFLAGSADDSSLELSYINFYGKGKYQGFDTYAIEVDKSSVAVELAGVFPRTSFVYLATAHVASDADLSPEASPKEFSSVDVRRSSHVSPGNIAFAWNRLTERLVTAMKN